MSEIVVRRSFTWAGLIGLLAILLALPAAPSSAGPLQQTATPIRPTLTPVAPGSAPTTVDENPSLAGYVWVNGDIFVPAVGVPVRFAGDGFELTTLTDVNGYYQFKQVGQDVGFLTVPENGSGWKASPKDVALSIPPGGSLRVNFSASQASPAKGPKLLSISVQPASVGAGQTVNVTIKATNTTGAKLSGVWVTHWLPDGLTISGATTDRGDVVMRGTLAMVNLGDLAPGDVATITVVALAPNDGGPQGSLPMLVSFISREGVSVQASTALHGMGGPSTLPVTGASEWLIGLGLILAVLLIGAHHARRYSRVLVD